MAKGQKLENNMHLSVCLCRLMHTHICCTLLQGQVVCGDKNW